MWICIWMKMLTNVSSSLNDDQLFFTIVPSLSLLKLKFRTFLAWAFAPLTIWPVVYYKVCGTLGLSPDGDVTLEAPHWYCQLALCSFGQWCGDVEVACFHVIFLMTRYEKNKSHLAALFNHWSCCYPLLPLLLSWENIIWEICN